MSISAKREMEVFQAALEISDLKERRKFIEQACHGNDELLVSVEDLLTAQARAEQFFARGASSLNSLAGQLVQGDSSVEQDSHPLFEERPGTVLGGYKVVQKIGEGGCGVVYLAEQAQPVRRRVALKVIKLGMDTRSVIARFEAERQALAMMDHPNIARVFDAGATETGRPYFVMEFVNGAKITEYCDQNQLGIERRLELFIQICQAIQHAHQKGVIHRDIKPSNILVTVHDGVPVVKVIDFGIAKAIRERLTDKTIFTEYAQVIGTPTYMSPEQAELNGEDLDTRSDIYSLGVLLYEVLTGSTPFDPKELTGSGLDSMRRMVRAEEPLTPSARLLALHGDHLKTVASQRNLQPLQVAAKVRGDLDWIAMKALEKDRSCRYDTASELAADVERSLKNQPILARPPNRWYLLQKLVRRNRLVVASGAAVVIALLIGAVVSTWLLVKERDAQRRVVAAQQEAKSRREAELLGRIAQAKLLLEANSHEKADKLFEGIVLENPSVDAAAVLRKLGRWHALGSRWRQAAERFELLVRVDRLDSLDTVTIDYFELGLALIKSGDLNGFERSRQEAIARYAGTANTYLDLILKFSLLLPANRQMMKDLVPQADFVEKAFSVAGQHRSHDSGAEAWHALALALFEYRRGDFAKAVVWCRRCLDNPQSVAPRGAAAEAVLAMSCWQMNQHQDALAALGRSHATIAKKFDPSADQESGSEHFWFDWEFAHILFRECEERFLQADQSLAQTSGATPNREHEAMFRVLGEWHALRNEWREASDRFSVLIDIDQRSDWEVATQDFLACGAALAKLNDQEGYERFRAGATARFKDTDNKTVAERIIKISLLRPADDNLLAALAPLEAVSVRPYNSTETDLKENMGYQTWNAVALGLLEYRRGDWNKAADWARRSLASSDNVQMPTSIGRLILAMSLHRLGQEEDARTEFRQGREVIEFASKYVDGSNWRDWLFGSILLGEATRLMPEADRPAESKAQ